jgi:hypothetical protein
MPPPRRPTAIRPGVLACVLIASAVLRAWDLGRLSLWYDEVVTVRLARADGPAALLRLLHRIDATRAPLHPLLLQGWVKLFGASEAAARGFSVCCGVLTVALVGRLGRRAFDDDATGLWSAGLAAVSPMLVLYAREARMYAWLVLVTCAAWDALLSLRPGATPGRLAWYAVALAVLGYSHPLGLLMIGALGLASLLNRRALGLTWARWLAPHLAAAEALAPWLGRYLDHDPESAVGPLPLKFLLGTPIGFIGGNSLTLAGFAALIAYGLIRVRPPALSPQPSAIRHPPSAIRHPPLGIDHAVAASCLLVWLTVPPTVLYVYSRLAYPIFGPARYTLFVAPAYLILVARGLARLPLVPRVIVAATTLGLAVWSLPATVYAPDLKADWRGAAAFLDRSDPSATEPVVVTSADPAHNVEVETARYYLGPRRPVMPMPERPEDLDPALLPGDGHVWFAVGLRGGRPASPLPDAILRHGSATDFPGLRIVAAGRSAVRRSR